MNVIFYSADLNCRHFVLSRYATDISPNALFDFLGNPGLTIPGAEREVIVKRRVGVGHQSLHCPSIVATRRRFSSSTDPGLERPG